MPIGSCRLCQKERPLQDSHLMPAGIYAIVRDGDHPADHPVLMMKGAAVATSAQARAHMLCAECERRFAQRWRRMGDRELLAWRR